MSDILWNPLNVSPEEEAMANEIINSGVGKRLSEEVMSEFRTGAEWVMEIGTRVGKTLVHMYRPEGMEGKELPLLINMHGGGFIKGRRDQDIVFCRNICSRSGFLVADVDYVPAPAMRYPGQVYACYDIVQYFAEAAAELHVIREKIAVAGHSAGGTLAAALNLMAIDNGTFVPALQILDYPGLDLNKPVSEKRNSDSNPRIPSWKAEFYNKMYADPEDTAQVYCSPALAADAQLCKMPATVMMYCQNDTFCDEDADFAARLMNLGVQVYAKCFHHSSHGFAVQRNGEYEVAEKMMLQALKALAEK